MLSHPHPPPDPFPPMTTDSEVLQKNYRFAFWRNSLCFSIASHRKYDFPIFRYVPLISPVRLVQFVWFVNDNEYTKLNSIFDESIKYGEMCWLLSERRCSRAISCNELLKLIVQVVNAVDWQLRQSASNFRSAIEPVMMVFMKNAWTDCSSFDADSGIGRVPPKNANGQS